MSPRNTLATCTVMLLVATTAGCDVVSEELAGLDEISAQFSEGSQPGARGGGRVDFPFGAGDSNSGQSRPQKFWFQTWGFDIRPDGNGDGLPEGAFQCVDHRSEVRPQCGDRPCNFQLVNWTSFQATDPKESCVGGGSQADGVLREKNTNSQYQFRLWSCDNGEPGSKEFPFDRVDLCIQGFDDPQATPEGYCSALPLGGNYHVRRAGIDTEGAFLTGGNVQVTPGTSSAQMAIVPVRRMSPSFSTLPSANVAGTATGASASTLLGTLPSTPYAVLPSTGGMDNDDALSVSVASVLTAQDLFAVTTGGGVVGDASVQSFALAEAVNILGGLITADGLMAMVTSTLTGTAAESEAVGSELSNLVVNGVAISPNVAPNTTIDIPGVATVIVNERIPEGDGITSTGLTLTMLHVLLKDPLTGATTGEIKVASARSAASN